MNKAIIVLSGTTPSKAKFIETVKKSAWLWNINISNFLGSRKNEFYWDGESGEYYQSFTHEFFALIYKYFTADNSETKIAKGKIFTKFVLIVNGVDESLLPVLKDQYGVFRIHVSTNEHKYNSECDFVICEEDENFESEVNRLISVLTNEKELV